MLPMTEDDHHLDKLVLSLTRRAYPDDDHAIWLHGRTCVRTGKTRLPSKTQTEYLQSLLQDLLRAKGARVARDKLLAWSLRASVTTRSTELTGRSENMPSDGSTSFLLLVAAGHSCDLRREHVGNVMQFSKMQSWSLQDSSWTVRCLQASRCSPPAMAGPGTWKPPSTRTFSHAGHHGRCTLVNLEGPNKQGKFNTAGRIRSQ